MFSLPKRLLSATAKRAVAVTTVLSTVSVLTACTIDRDGHNDAEAVGQQTQSEAPEVKLSANVKDGDSGVEVTEPIVVTASEKLDSVSLINDAGEEIDGKLNADKTEFTVDQKLGYGRTYTIQAKAGGKKLDRSFTTIQPASQDTAALSPLDGATVGVGQTIGINFDVPIQDRQAVQDAIKVTTTPKVEGAFYWISGNVLRWRPKDYWVPGTKVKVEANLYGVDLGGGHYGSTDRKSEFTIGDDVRGVVDDATKQLTFTKNGEVIKTMPVSNGRDTAEWATPNGTYTVGDQFEDLKMDSRTFGYSLEAGGYVTDVKYATQMSYSGIYVHAAPWSVGQQGYVNTSHGCVNVSMANAQWVYNNIKRGDIIEVKNTVGRQLSGVDGLGDWQIDWETWKAGNVEI